jgi:hypothetical protein
VNSIRSIRKRKDKQKEHQVGSPAKPATCRTGKGLTESFCLGTYSFYYFSLAAQQVSGPLPVGFSSMLEIQV